MSLLAGITVTTLAHGDDDDAGDDADEDADHINKNSHPKLLVISLDGFRHDYIDMYKPLSLTGLAQRGVRARSLSASYITKTFPNHYTIATGLHEETHGIVANNMYDALWNETFHSCSSSECSQWYGGQPIWNTNELNNKQNKTEKVRNNRTQELIRMRRHGGESHDVVTPYSSGSIYWPGGAASVNNMNITFSRDYVNSDHDNYLNFTQRIDLIISWFTDRETPINLGMLYNEYPDRTAHKYGPKSDEVRASVLEIDEGIAYLLDQLKSHKLQDVNIIVLSDHGFADVDGFVYLEDCIASDRYLLTDNTPVMHIWPIDNSHELKEELYRNLSNCKGMTRYYNDSIELVNSHYSNNRRIPPIVVVSDIPEDDLPAKLILQARNSTNWDPKGNHGWNNTWEKMHALFIASGPAFKSGKVHDPFLNVHIYPLMCEVLKIKCPTSNGSLSAVSDMLITSNALLNLETAVIVGLVCAIVSSIILVGAIKLWCSPPPPHNSREPNKAYGLPMSAANGLEGATLLESSDEEF
ncbi:bis(5'-adenosyl)-triphosphatase enpp4-like [Watersipora subatra]|uniref:bis(5'-adenosyl)-triphosphatase enpp4-like n=1 Tax=Watersipora subatra TaxID=2589382 RepID=UPI00355B7341